ncbi:MAG: 5,10-methylenetetrahydrofolate reductase [Deltaproteobacteria bacterium RIFCSPLOWO2_12_FULL_43_16]|nr:MAG: 5,10-methylenetetrahydrofolate reductase [Deltaproteobacteria bacterium GWA2_43_19]OGQ09245.1 MAG: 5,10-methylenetetrahydrofolate reductase [Deltaproteobacteria bacterium RIFCSPHIGHO2_02_FULL_43_33]OGQ38568.1 MAG: 5,10-methylenetetrahydrofolate reductase [Deltaproteobacteria bacterium RIFCSPLOWO2_01_FULL_42_9]OGQ57812.1 MAG: 5,10-methylenetetrahydrofolate reductase [Deltaproteobacteria bacterium RIFCSPLOWO2_12_FULL_43_16]HBR16294.1 5,10-methylenetetrahydrofolate reductase [Deltaproteoba
MHTLKDSLSSKKFTITAEICPPKGTDVSDFLKKAQLLKDKIAAANVTDNQRAVMRLSSLACSVLLLKQGLDPVFQMTCRDRNRIAIQSDIMGAWTLGVKNILALSGDHVSFGDHREAKAVFDLDSVQLVQVINKLNSGTNMKETPLKGGTGFFIGAVVAPEAEPWEPEMIKFEKKIEAGARFFQTQAIYDIDKFHKFYEYARKFDVKILGGILLLKSAKMAHFLNTNVPGVTVPKHLIDELEKAKDQLEKGIEIAARQVKELKKFCDGAHIMAIGQEESVVKIIEGAG